MTTRTKLGGAILLVGLSPSCQCIPLNEEERDWCDSNGYRPYEIGARTQSAEKADLIARCIERQKEQMRAMYESKARLHRAVQPSDLTKPVDDAPKVAPR